MTKEEIEQLKLSSEESTQLNVFIAKSVRGNYSFTVFTNRVTAPQMGIQELYNQSEQTLVVYAGILDKNIRGHVTNFNPRVKGEKAYMMGKVKGTELLDILQLIIREKAYNAELENRADTRKALQAEFDNMKTPEEKRADIKAKLAELDA